MAAKKIKKKVIKMEKIEQLILRKSSLIFFVIECCIGIYGVLVGIINFLNLAGIISFTTWFMKPAFMGASLLLLLVLQYGFFDIHPQNKVLLKIRPYMIGGLAAIIASSYRLPLFLLLMLTVGYILINGYSIKQSTQTLLTGCIGLEIYNIAMVFSNNVSDKALERFFGSPWLDIFLVLVVIIYYWENSKSKEEGKLVPEKSRHFSHSSKWKNWINFDFEKIMHTVGYMICLFSCGLFLYFAVIVAAGTSGLSHAQVLSYPEDPSFVLTEVKREKDNFYDVSFQKGIIGNNQRIYINEVDENIFQFAFLESGYVLTANKIQDSAKLALTATAPSGDASQYWRLECIDENGESLYHWVPLSYGSLLNSEEISSTTWNMSDKDYNFFSLKKIELNGFITSMLRQFREDFKTTTLMEDLMSRFGSFFALLFFCIIVFSAVVIYLRRLIGNKLSNLNLVIFAFLLAYGSMTSILMFVIVLGIQCLSSYYCRIYKEEGTAKFEYKRIQVFQMFFCLIICIVLFTIVMHNNTSLAVFEDNPIILNPDMTYFTGIGTQDEPYLVSNAFELGLLRDMVNDYGYTFEGCYFRQTQDIDLGADTIWEPIGLFGSGRYFMGTYDGDGHKIDNLICVSSEITVNNGLFGALGGQVLNLGIESGRIEGAYIGSIASHSTGSKAAIINCYNRASVVGTGRAGGICDNFSGGNVINCVNLGEIDAPCKGELVSYSAKYVINGFPEENAFTDNFKGSFSNYFSINTDNIYELLNNGIDYMLKMEMFTEYNLKYWEE